MFRAHETILKGKYQLISSSNDNMKKLNLTLSQYGVLKIEYDDSKSNFYGTAYSWYVDRGNGYLGIYGGEEDVEYKLEYCYCLTKDGLYLLETDYSDTYYLKKVD